jgi:anti-anti-sigma regulatory factor
VESLPDRAGIRVAGEVDATVRDSWHTALAPLAAVDRDVHLDLSALTFIDVRGVAELIDWRWIWERSGRWSRTSRRAYYGR